MKDGKAHRLFVEDNAFLVSQADSVHFDQVAGCLLYTSDAADERSSVDLGGRRIIKKKNKETSGWPHINLRKSKQQ